MVTKKIAFLCLAHNNFDYLAAASHYYCSDGDGFFLHIDSNVRGETLANFDKNTVMLAEHERYRTAWGSFNIVLATLALLKKALATQQYDQFILISGVDLPLLTKAELKVRLAQETSYLSIWQQVKFDNLDSYDQNSVQKSNHLISAEFFKRHNYDHALTNPGEAYNSGSRAKIYRMLMLNKLIRLLPLAKKKFTYATYAKGSQWWCVTAEMAAYFCQELANPDVAEQFKKMHAPDEKTFQTLAINSPFTKKLSIDHQQSSLKQGVHYIDWGYQKEKVALQLFTLIDVEKAKTLGCAFARKLNLSDTPANINFVRQLIS